MKLSEIINYRKECFIHKLPMKICKSFKETNNPSGNQGLVSCAACCHACQKKGFAFFPFFPETLGMISLNNLDHQEHSYIFRSNTLTANSDFTLLEENIQYVVDNKLYRMSVDLVDKNVVFRFGHHDLSMSVEQAARSFSTMRSDDFDPHSIQDLPQLMQKIQLYNLYS